MHINCRIAGVYYLDDDTKQFLKELKKDSLLNLIPEPDNQFDANAIRVTALGEELEDIHLGYVPKVINESILAEMTKNPKLRVVFKGGQNILISTEDYEKFDLADLANLL
jgi:hypothetical protein